jgi:ribonucleoside-triphosphate reductase (thioredoxin)
MVLLTDELMDTYPDFPEHMNELGSFVYYRTYSRWLDTEGRRETWKEAVRRAVEYNANIALDEFEKNDMHPPLDKVQEEVKVLFDNIFNLRQFLSGRTHWVGGAEGGVADKFPLANFNCSFLNITKYDDLGDLFYLLLVGTGVGFKCTKEMAYNLPPIRDNFELLESPYAPLPKWERNELTGLQIRDNTAHITVGDSKEGWVDAMRHFFELITLEAFNHVKDIRINYDSVRPKGERLRTFGGTASGHEPLKEMFEGITQVIKGTLDTNIAPPERVSANYVTLRPIHILDIGNLIGNNVVVGGVRRTAEIFLMDSDDWECILAKYGINGIWNEEHHNTVISALENLSACPDWLRSLPLNNENARPMHHRRMSNNSIAFTSKPSREMLNLIFTIMQGEGEPGFINLEEANRRRPNAEGINPCAEIILDSYGVCNLTTVNVDAFVRENDGIHILDYQGLCQAQALSTRAGMRMTCLDLELPHWDKVQKRDRLIGTSLTGWKDAMSKLAYTDEQEANLLYMLREVASMESLKYSKVLRIPIPLLDTTVKPEGTLSQVAGGVSSGLHMSHSPYYIRRIRINAQDPLVSVAKELEWTINPEVGQDPENPRTVVIDFPVKSAEGKTKDDVYVDEQFDTYFRFQEDYTSHNSSNTIHVRPDEWEQAEQRVWDGWDKFVGVSFLAYDGGSYALAPYEQITEEEYHELKDKMKPFDHTLISKYEQHETDKDTENMENCEGGACPIF